jgi:hypothetical protein
MMTDEDTDEQDEQEAQFRTATEGLQQAVMRLFQDSDIRPHVMVLALARVTGEVGAGTALAEEQDPEEMPGELAEVVRRAGREFRETLEAEALPTAGNARGRPRLLPPARSPPGGSVSGPSRPCTAPPPSGTRSAGTAATPPASR